MPSRLMQSAIRAAMTQDWLVRVATRRRCQGADAALDRQVAAALEYQRLMRMPGLETMQPAAARTFAENNVSTAELRPEPMDEVIDMRVGEGRTPVRIYRPHGAGVSWIVWLHGGGGVIGSIAGSDSVARYLAAHTRCTVASVGYRLGPEDKHPAAIDDACAVWEALLPRVAGGRVAVGGDSFGGLLAAHVDRFARDAGIRQPDLQILVYPLVDLTLTSPSIDRHAEGYLLTKAMMVYFRDHYLNAADDREAASPWFWSDLAGSAPAIVVTAGYDPLVDEGDRWAERLEAAGVAVRHRQHPSLVHGFLSLAGIVRAAHRATDQLCQDVVAMLVE